MAHKDIIVVGASAGGIAALTEFVKNLPENLNASVFIVLHLSPYSKSLLPQILSKAGPLKAGHPEDGEKIKRSKVYLAPPDHDLLLEEDRMRITKGGVENRFCPSIDNLFRSAASVYGPRVIGVVLSGMLDDGTNGLIAVKKAGGTCIIQQPEDAHFSSMPQHALNEVEVDYIVRVSEMGALIKRLTTESVMNSD